MESRNAKFLENGLISGSRQFHDNLSERDHYQGQALDLSHRLSIIHTREVESGIRQTIIRDPHTSKPIDHVIEDQQNVEQPVEQKVPYEETTLTRATRVRNSDYNIGAEHDPETFSQAICSKESELWYEAMKDEMDSMASNRVWDLVELPYGIKSIGCKWVFKTNKDSQGNIERHKTRLVAKGFTQREGIDYMETFFLYLGKILFV